MSDAPCECDNLEVDPSGPSVGSFGPTLPLRFPEGVCCEKIGPLTVLLQRFFASVGGTGGSRACSLGWVGEWPRVSPRVIGSEGNELNDGGKVMNEEFMMLKAGRAVISGSTLLPGGKGYSKRGETSNGVPTIGVGECSDKLARLSRGLSDMEALET